MMMPAPPVISVIMPCRNEAAHLGAVLDSLLAQELGQALTAEFLIADGMSTDRTREIAAEYARRDARIRLIDNPAGFVSHGMNAGIRAARGTIIIRLDAHSHYAPDYLRRCAELLEQTGAANVGGPARTVAEGLIPETIAAAYHSRFACGGAQFHDCEYEGFTDTVPYGCWRKATLVEIGLFDEELVRNQDDELNLRLIRSGGKIWQSPSIRSYYHPRASFSALFRQYFQYGYWKVAVMRKHRIPASWRHLVPGAFVAAHLMLAAAVAVTLLAGQTQLAAVAAGLWAAMTGLYLLASLAAAVAMARVKGWRLLPLLPLAFAIYHVSYGLGFVLGLARPASRRGRGAQPGSGGGSGQFATGITR